MYRLVNKLPAAALASTLLLALLLAPAVAEAQQQPDPESPRYKGLVLLTEFLASTGDEALTAFLQNHIAPAVQEEMTAKELLAKLDDLRKAVAGLSSRGARPVGPFAAEVIYSLPDGGQLSAAFELDPEDPERFTNIRIGDLAL